MNERIDVQPRFSQDVRVMIYTDIGGEGLNLKFCHVVINYDIPGNPMKLDLIVVHERKEHAYIPHDLAVRSSYASVDLAELIPTIDAKVLRKLPISLLYKLYSDEITHTHKRLLYDESKNFILRSLYGIDPLFIRNNVQLFRFLLHIHYDRPEISESLLRFISEHLSKRLYPSVPLTLAQLQTP